MNVLIKEVKKKDQRTKQIKDARKKERKKERCY